MQERPSPADIVAPSSLSSARLQGQDRSDFPVLRRSPSWLGDVILCGAAAVFIGGPTGLALFLLTGSDQPIWLRAFPEVVGFLAMGTLYYVRARRDRHAITARVAVAVSLILLADVFVIAAWARSRGLL